jgi:NhaC family Na+:H+ antiporter
MVPFLAACGMYTILGFWGSGNSGEIPDLQSLFGREFVLSWIALIPAIVILILSMMQVNVKKAMTVSILSALPISIFVQGTSIGELPMLLWSGYRAVDAEVSAMINGGGITSMIRVGCIVSLSSAFSGIFRKTGLLDNAKQLVFKIAERTNPYTAILCTGMVASMIACNQTLAIMLTEQLCEQVEPDGKKRALDLENSTVLVAALVPWSIACATPLASVNAPIGSVLFAFFLYFVPAWRLIVEAVSRKKKYA